MIFYKYFNGKKTCRETKANARAVSIAFLLLIIPILLSEAIDSDPIDSKHGMLPPPVPLHMFRGTLFSSIDDIELEGESIGNIASSATENWWASYTSKGWNTFLDGEEETSPFIVCHDGQSMSGRERSIDVYSFLSNLGISEETDFHEGHILYSTEALTCLYIISLPSMLVDLSSHQTEKGVSIAIQPVMNEMKAASGLASILKDESFLSERWDYISDTDHKKTIKLRTSLCSKFRGTKRRSVLENTSTRRKLNISIRENSPLEQISTRLKLNIESKISSDEMDIGIGGMGSMTNISPEKCKSWIIPSLSNLKLSQDGHDMQLELSLPTRSSFFNGSHFDTGWITPCFVAGIDALMSHRAVCNFSILPDIKNHNLEARWITQGGGVSHSQPFYQVDLRGAGQIAAVSDSGVDVNSCFFADTVNPVKFMPENAAVNNNARKIVQYTSYNDNMDDTSGHGTHVAGSILGKADGSTSLFFDNSNGIAENAKLSFFDLGDSNGYLKIPLDLTALLTPGFDAGAKIHSASWGSVGVNWYDAMDRDFDRFQYKNPEFLILVAAGNDGMKGMNTVSSPAVAKNIISVGATQSSGSSISFGMKGMDYLASFSSKGPTRDLRIKPDVVAPGQSVYSAKAQPNESSSCEVQKLDGTSMATPITSGNALLVRQYFEEGFQIDGTRDFSKGIVPTAALVKAVLMNGAQYLVGIDDGSSTSVSPYDANQGFGRISLLDSLPLKDENSFGMYFVDRRKLRRSQKDTISLIMSNTEGACQLDTFTATLVWTDLPSRKACRECLMNDLDLSVTHNDARIYPNGFATRDHRNTVERVRIQIKVGDIVTVEVAAKNLVGLAQNYALVATGCFDVTQENMQSVQEPIPAKDATRSILNPTKESGGMKGLLIAIIVLIAVAVAGLYLKRKFFFKPPNKETMEPDTTDHTNLANRNNTCV